MKASLRITGVGLGGFKGLGINIGSAAYFQIGQNPSVRNYGIIDCLSLGEKTHTFAFGHVATEPFHLGEAEYKSLMRLDHLTGKSMQIEVIGTLAGKGAIDLRVLLIDNQGIVETIVERMGIPAAGAQFATTRIRGRIRLLPSNVIFAE